MQLGDVRLCEFGVRNLADLDALDDTLNLHFTHDLLTQFGVLVAYLVVLVVLSVSRQGCNLVYTVGRRNYRLFSCMNGIETYKLSI